MSHLNTKYLDFLGNKKPSLILGYPKQGREKYFYISFLGEAIYVLSKLRLLIGSFLPMNDVFLG
jgi:hypothetical protein